MGIFEQVGVIVVLTWPFWFVGGFAAALWVKEKSE